MGKKSILLIASFNLAVFAPAAMPSKADRKPQDSQVYAAYVLLGQAGTGETVAMARVIQDASVDACPQLVPLSGEGPAVSMTPRRNPDPKHFPVQVCEAAYPDGKAMAVAKTGFSLPKVGGPVHKVTAIGDTGCKPEKGNKNICSKNWWPFPTLAQNAASAREPADLILHMGDYNYRGTPGSIQIRGHKEKKHVYDAGDNAPNGVCKLTGPYYGQNSKGSMQPDNWNDWWLDMFQPAQQLLQTAPWVFTRGNHELCSRAGTGWFYFLDANSVLLGEGAEQLSCPSPEKKDAKDSLVFVPPYRVDLPNMTVLVVDSANACDSGDLHQKHYDKQFAALHKLVQQAPVANHTWFMSHRPFTAVKNAGDGVACKDPKTGKTYGCINETLQTALSSNPLPVPIHLTLAGHMHRFQSVSFPATDKGPPPPPQLVIGNGGVELASNHPKSSFAIEVAEFTGLGFGLSRFGYMDFTLGTSGNWSGNLLGPAEADGQPILAQCDSSEFSATGVCWPVEN